MTWSEFTVTCIVAFNIGFCSAALFLTWSRDTKPLVQREMWENRSEPDRSAPTLQPGSDRPTRHNEQRG